MNAIILSSLLCLVFSAAGVQGSVATLSAELSHVTGASASGEREGPLSTFGDEDEEDVGQNEDLSGGSPTDSQSQLPPKDQKEKGRRRKGKGGKDKRRTKAKSTTAFNPEYTSGYTSPGLLSETTSGRTQAIQTSDPVTEDPCSSSHQGYCIHGNCKYMADLREPVCICNKGYDGERCGILLLQTKLKNNNSSGAERGQTVLVVIAVVLSIISCLAILLMTCSHYRTHKNFLAAYLGSGSEKEHLQKTTPCDLTV
ncbi:proheparin-binding EGF-like growth factor [Esox lucius]|uniref:EGF-like domain-containing protein n=1 Tax=Esox lucius TaxID=8010 RepID=A0A3P9AN69_ESOLU|nr:proheparin-binding EGF-like growth factor [Esox lucius]